VRQIPLIAAPAQTQSISLSKQNCKLSVYQRGDALYCDLTVNGAPVLATKICRNRIRLMLGAEYRPFVGDLVFVDTQGDSQPHYTGLDGRFVLLYLEATEV